MTIDRAVPEAGDLECLLDGRRGGHCCLGHGSALGSEVGLERGGGRLVEDARAREAVGLLECLDGVNGRRAVYAVDLAVVSAATIASGTLTSTISTKAPTKVSSATSMSSGP